MPRQQTNLEILKQEQIDMLQGNCEKGILEQSNVTLLTKLINNADNETEVLAIAQLGTTYKRTGLHYDKKLEKTGDEVKYFVKNEDLSFVTDENAITHKLIIGDNYDALLNLLITHRGKIDVIYIDPPYGKDKMGAFADTNYDNAITRDNLLSMLYPRLTLAKLLLSDEGVIFVSIDDRNQAYVKCLMDEVFEENCFVVNLPTIMNLKGNQDEYAFAGTHEYTLVYTKTFNGCDFRGFNIDEEEEDEWLEDEIGFYKKGANLKSTGVNAPREKRPNLYFPIYVCADGKFSVEKKLDDAIEVYPITDGQEMSWRWSKNKFKNEYYNVIISIDNGQVSINKKQRPSIGDLPSKKPKSVFYKPEYSSGNGTSQIKKIFSSKVFDNPKPIDLIKDLVLISSRDNSIILDFFAGSGTTGQAVLALNKEDGGHRQFILCTNNEEADGFIATNVTSKRLKRVMTGKCYDGSADFKWAEENEPYGDNLEVVEIAQIKNNDRNIFKKIDETLYGQKFEDVKDKIDWVCANFAKTQKVLE